MGGTAATRWMVIPVMFALIAGLTHAAPAVGRAERSSGTARIAPAIAGASSSEPSWLPTDLQPPAGAASNPVVTLEAVACSAVGSCAAVGNYVPTSGNAQGLITTLAGGTWTTETASLPAGATSVQGDLGGVTCPAAGTCVAVGWYQDNSGQRQGVIEMLSGGQWTASLAQLPVGGVSAELGPGVTCTSVGFCVTVGAYQTADGVNHGLIETFAGGTWTPTEAQLPGDASSGPTGAALDAVSCAAQGSCVATGVYTLQGGGSTAGLIETLSGGAWTPQQSPAPANEGVGTVSCPAAGSCAAVAGTDSLLTSSGDTWTAVQAQPPANGLPGQVYLGPGLTCSSADPCVTVGQYAVQIGNQGVYHGLFETLSGGTWTPAEAQLPANANQGTAQNANLAAVACPATDTCAAVGGYIDTNGNAHGLIETLSGGTWMPAEAFSAASTADQTGLQSVACLGTGYCVAAGYYIDTNGNVQGLIETSSVAGAGVPGPPQNVQVAPGNGYASVVWTSPADQGDSPITQYIITATPFGNTDYYSHASMVTASVDANGAGGYTGEITGLVEDCHQEYTFTVSAVNSSGTGPPAVGSALFPNQPSPPDATGSPPHFRTSGIVRQGDNPPPVVVVTVDGFTSNYFLDRGGNPQTATIDPLVGVNAAGGQQVDSSGDGLPISYCMEGEQGGSKPTPNASVPAAIWPTDEHFDLPGFDPGFLNTSGQYVKTHHYLLDQLVEGGGVALPYSYTSAATLSSTRTGVPSFTFTGYTAHKSGTQEVVKDVTLLAREVNSIHATWPTSRIVLLGHSGGGLIVEQYWQNYQYAAENVRLVVSIEGPINGTARTGQCSPLCPSVGGFGDKVLNFLGQLWQNQQSNDAAILNRNTGGTFIAISTEGDSTYGFVQNGVFDSIVPDSVFSCDVTSFPWQVNSCNPSQPPSLVDGGHWRVYDPCQWTSDLQNALEGKDFSHEYAIGCPQNADYIRSSIFPG